MESTPFNFNKLSDNVKTQNFELSDADFYFLCEFIGQASGIVLGDQKRQLVHGRLVRRLNSLGLNSFTEYCELLRNDPDSEIGALISAISTNVTAFFREEHHFEFLANELLPNLITERKQGGRIRIWSAGCATGEEPYTIAMVLAEALEKTGACDAKILATDISPQALETAKQGVYRLDRMTGINEARQQRWFRQGTGGNQGWASAHPRLRELITFRPLNLLGSWPMRGPFDVIFCRNVVIYFDKPTKEQLFARYAGILNDHNGYLFLGHSESLYGLSSAFKLVGRTIYRKQATTDQ